MYDFILLYADLLEKLSQFTLILFELKNSRTHSKKKKRKNEFVTSLRENGETAVSFGTEMTDRGANENARKIT